MLTKENKELTLKEKIAQWKKKYGEVFVYEADGKKCYLRKPDRKTLGAASVIGKNDPMKYNEVMINNCWLDGNEILRENDGYFLGLSAQIAELIEIKEGEIKKL